MGFNLSYIVNDKIGTTQIGVINGENRNVAPVLKNQKFWESTFSGTPRKMNTDRDGNIYFGTTAGKVMKMSPTDGSLLETYKIGTGLITNVVVDKVHGHILTSGHGDKNVKSTRQDGTLIWEFKGDNVPISGVAFDQETRHAFCCDDNGSVKRIDTTGIQVWNHATTLGYAHHITLYDGFLYVGFTDGSINKITMSGSLVWSKKLSIAQTRSLKGFGGFIYATFGDGDASVKKLDLNGNLVWTKTFDRIIEDLHTNVDGIYVGDFHGSVYLFGFNGNLKWKAEGVNIGTSANSVRGIITNPDGTQVFTVHINSRVVCLSSTLRIDGYVIA